MLSDPLLVAVPNVSVEAFPASDMTVIPFFTVDVNPGGTVRKAVSALGGSATLTIAHSLSKENAPFQTERTLLRLDITKVNEETGKPVTASVYAVAALPKGADFTLDELRKQIVTLGWLLCLGTAQAIDQTTVQTSSMDRIDGRLLAGEP